MKSTKMNSNPAGHKLCRRCNENQVTLKIRSEAICRFAQNFCLAPFFELTCTNAHIYSRCYHRFVNVKTVKRLEKLALEIGAAPMHTKRILVGLSFGPSSAALVDILNDQIQSHLRKRPSAAFEVVVVHVDPADDMSPTDHQAGDGGGGGDGGDSPSPLPPPEGARSGHGLLDRYAERYPHFRFVRAPLAAALELDTIDWSALPLAPSRDAGSAPPAERLSEFLAQLPSTTSRADVMRLFVRHVLVSVALREACRAVLLGCSTTALAELTLGETAKGRGFSLPSMVGDGPLVIQRFPPRAQEGTEGSAEAHATAESGNGKLEKVATLSIHYPNREVFRNELIQYAALAEPPLTDMLLSKSASSSAVVSHRDVSIDDVMTRYFVDVEKNYPSIVANVVRTTGKLNRAGNGGEEECCGLCGMALDELGDERWKGEIGEDGGDEDGRLCYGCSRAMRR